MFRLNVMSSTTSTQTLHSRNYANDQTSECCVSLALSSKRRLRIAIEHGRVTNGAVQNRYLIMHKVWKRSEMR